MPKNPVHKTSVLLRRIALLLADYEDKESCPLPSVWLKKIALFWRRPRILSNTLHVAKKKRSLLQDSAAWRRILSQNANFAKENRSFRTDSEALLGILSKKCRLCYGKSLFFWRILIFDLSKHVSYAKENRSFLTGAGNWQRLLSKNVSFGKEDPSFWKDFEACP